jgi:hypothetical protein
MFFLEGFILGHIQDFILGFILGFIQEFKDLGDFRRKRNRSVIPNLLQEPKGFSLYSRIAPDSYREAN